MQIFAVLQDPKSKYNDIEGKCYNFPIRIANGKQIREGDFILFFLSAQSSKKKGYKGNIITGLAKIDNITFYNEHKKIMAMASYSWYRGFEKVLLFSDIGGDPRSNIQHSMSKVERGRQFDLLAVLITNL